MTLVLLVIPAQQRKVEVSHVILLSTLGYLFSLETTQDNPDVQNEIVMRLLSFE